MAAKKKTSKKGASEKTPSKTSFVLGFPRDMPAAEVVVKAKEAGIPLTDKYVYNIRASARAAGKTAKKKPGPKPGAKRKASGAGNGSVESRFVDLALDVGLARAEEMLRTLRATVKSIVL